MSVNRGKGSEHILPKESPETGPHMPVGQVSVNELDSHSSPGFPVRRVVRPKKVAWVENLGHSWEANEEEESFPRRNNPYDCEGEGLARTSYLIPATA